MITVEDFLSHAGVKGMKWGSRKFRPVASADGYRMQPVAKPGFQMKPVAPPASKPGFQMKPVSKKKATDREKKRNKGLVSMFAGNSFVGGRLNTAESQITPLSALRNRGSKQSLGEKFAAGKIDMSLPADFATQARNGPTLRR
jgi:hypothetical protein